MWNWDPVGDIQQQHPYFAVLAQPGTPTPGISSFSTNIGPTSKFLYQPSPVLTVGTSGGVYPYTPGTGCDPARASTPHSAGIQVALADGSCRTIAANVSGQTWWAACTPNSGDTLGPDW